MGIRTLDFIAIYYELVEPELSEVGRMIIEAMDAFSWSDAWYSYLIHDRHRI